MTPPSFSQEMEQSRKSDPRRSKIMKLGSKTEHIRNKMLHFRCNSLAPWFRLHLASTSPTPRLHLGYTSAALRLHLACTSAARILASRLPGFAAFRCFSIAPSLLLLAPSMLPHTCFVNAFSDSFVDAFSASLIHSLNHSLNNSLIR